MHKDTQSNDGVHVWVCVSVSVWCPNREILSVNQDNAGSESKPLSTVDILPRLFPGFIALTLLHMFCWWEKCCALLTCVWMCLCMHAVCGYIFGHVWTCVTGSRGREQRTVSLQKSRCSKRVCFNYVAFFTLLWRKRRGVTWITATLGTALHKLGI